MPESSQLTTRCGDADLEVGRRRALEPVLVDRPALRSCCGPFRGPIGERRLRRRWPGRGKGEEFPQIVGLRHAQSHVAWGPRALERRQRVVPGRVSERVRAEAQQNRFDDRVWSNSVCETEPGSIHGETISAGTRTP